MRYLRITGEPDLEIVPDAFRIITASEHVREARLEAFNIGGSAVHFLTAREACGPWSTAPNQAKS